MKKGRQIYKYLSAFWIIISVYIKKGLYTMDYMENILEELYLCKIYPKYYKLPDTPEYKERVQRNAALAERLLAGLGNEEKEIYEEWRDNLDIISDLEMMQSFATGYLLASQIMIDVAAHMNNPKLVKMRNIVRKVSRKKRQKCIVIR